MDFNSTVGLCRLCLNESDDVMNIFDKFENTTIASILEQHFWFQVNKGEGLPECICQICWNNTKTFHIFYEEVELLQEDYWNSVKAVDYNVRTDSIKQEPELQIEETKLESSAVILEVIKKETNDYHSDDQIETDPTPSKNVDLEQYTKTNRTVKCLQVNNATKMKNIIKEKKPNDDEYRFNDDALDAQLHVFFSMKCDICGDPFDTYLSSLKHFRAAHKRRGYLTCCGNKFHRRIGMVNHIKYHLNPDAFSCHQCDRKFVNQGALALHLANHEPISSRAFKCDFCQKSYAREALLIRHKYFVHSPAKCVECDISYPSKSKLTTHLRNAHQLKGTSTEVCDICGKDFLNKYTLLNHLKERHSTSESSKFQCDICGIWLKYKSRLRAHMVQHQLAPAKCSLCGKVKKSKFLLTKHMQYVHTEKKHPCSICNKSFRTPRNLKEHMAGHTGQDLYECPYCPRTFKSSANMYSHRKKMHISEWTEEHANKRVSFK